MAVVVSAIIYVGASAVGAAVVGAVGITGLSAVAVTAIGAGVIAGGAALIQGQSLGDAFKTALTAGATSFVGGKISQSVSQYVSNTATSLNISPETSKIIGNIVGNAAGSGTKAGLTAALSGGDFFESFKKAGLAALATGTASYAASKITSSLGLKTNTGNAVQDAFARATNSALAGALTGQKFSTAFANSLSNQFKSYLANSAWDIAGAAIEGGAGRAYEEAERIFSEAKANFDNSAKYANTPAGKVGYYINREQYLLKKAPGFSTATADQKIQQIISSSTNPDGSFNQEKFNSILKNDYGIVQDTRYTNEARYRTPWDGNSYVLSGPDAGKEFAGLVYRAEAYKITGDELRAKDFSDLAKIGYDLTPAEIDAYQKETARLEQLAQNVGSALELSVAEEARNTDAVYQALKPQLDAVSTFYQMTGRVPDANEQAGLVSSSDPELWAFDRAMSIRAEVQQQYADLGYDVDGNMLDMLAATGDITVMPRFGDPMEYLQKASGSTVLDELGAAGSDLYSGDAASSKKVTAIGEKYGVTLGYFEKQDFKAKGYTFYEIEKVAREKAAERVLKEQGFSGTGTQKEALLGAIAGLNSLDDMASVADSAIVTADELQTLKDLYGTKTDFNPSGFFSEAQAEDQIKRYAVIDGLKAAKLPTQSITDDLVESILASGGQANLYQRAVNAATGSLADLFLKDLPEYDKDFYVEERKAINNALIKGDTATAEKIKDFIDKGFTTDDEARQYLIDAYSAVGIDDYEPTPEEISQIAGRTENISYLTAQSNAGYGATTFDGSGYANAQEASAAAKAAGYNTFKSPDGNTYTVIPSPVEEASVRAEAEEKKTFSEAFATARAKLGPGKTFTWNGKQYTTNILPKDVFDASKASSVTAAATLAYANGKDKFIGPDGKQYTVPKEAKAVLDNSLNQSQAETNRLLAQAIKPAQDEYPAETQRLMESGTRGTMDVIGAMTAQALGTTQRGVANLLMNAGKTYAAITGDLDFDNALVQVGKEIEQYAQQRDIYGLDIQKNRLAQAMEQANETDSWLEKTKIIGSAIKNNSIGFFDVAGSEVVEEIPETVLQIGIALATGGTSLAASGAIAAISAAGSVVETFGNTVEDAYKKAKQQGDSEDVAMQKAYLSGVIGTTIEMGTELVADKALLAPFLEKVSGSLISTATGYLTSTAIGAASEFAAGISQSYATQYIVNPETASLSKAATDGIFEMYIGGVAQGTLGLPGYAMQGATVIGKDYYGNNVTLDQAASGVIVDSSTINPNTVIGEAGDGNIVTLGSAMYSMPSYQFDMATLETYVPQVFSNNNIIVGQDALGNNITLGDILTGADGDVDVRGAIADFASIDADDRIEAQTAVIEQAMRDAGYTSFKPEDVQALVNPTNPAGTQSFIDAATTYADPRVTDAEEARQMLLAAGYTNPTNEEIQRFVGSIPELQSTTAISEYVAPRMVTEEEARQFFESQGYTPTEEEVAQFVRQGADILQDQVQQELVQYVDPRQVTQEEAEKFFRDLGYDFTPEEVAQFVQQGPNVLQDAVAGNVSTYVDPRMVDEQEVRDAYAALGLKKPTQDDVLKLVGQYAETDLAGRATENLDSARYNSIIEQLDGLAAGASQETLDAIELVKQDLNGQITALGGDVEALRQGIDSRFGQVSEQIGQVSAETKQQYEALTAEQKALADALAQQGVSLSDAIAAAQEQTAGQIAGVQADVQAKYDALTAEQKALADALAQQGLDLGDAINLAKSSLEAQIGGVSAEMQAQYAALSQGQRDIVDQMVQQGADMQTALDAAVSGLQGQMESQYNALTAGQKQLADQLVQQGLDLGDAITVAKSELQAQIEQTAQILGKPAQQVTQGDIDLVTQMIGQQDQNLAYDVNRDGQINQADVDILTRQLTNIDEPWTPAEGTIWAPTGLYAENAALQQQQKAQYDALVQELAKQEQARKDEAARAARAAQIGQVRTGIQNLAQQLPQVYQQSLTTTKPIYAGQTNFVDINAPLQVGGIFDVWGTTANQQRQTKMASGGYLNMQGEPESWEDILRMLNK